MKKDPLNHRNTEYLTIKKDNVVTLPTKVDLEERMNLTPIVHVQFQGPIHLKFEGSIHFPNQVIYFATIGTKFKANRFEIRTYGLRKEYFTGMDKKSIETVKELLRSFDITVHEKGMICIPKPLERTKPRPNVGVLKDPPASHRIKAIKKLTDSIMDSMNLCF